MPNTLPYCKALTRDQVERLILERGDVPDTEPLMSELWGFAIYGHRPDLDLRTCIERAGELRRLVSVDIPDGWERALARLDNEPAQRGQTG